MLLKRRNIGNVENSELNGFRNLTTVNSEENIYFSRLSSLEFLNESPCNLLDKWQDFGNEKFSNSKNLSEIYREDLSAYDLPNV